MIDCEYVNPCFNSIIDSVFINNTANSNGGGIEYTSYRPTLTGNQFINNVATYGNNIASFPARIMVIASNGTLIEPFNIADVPSGLAIEEVVELAIVDEDLNIMVSLMSLTFYNLEYQHNS